MKNILLIVAAIMFSANLMASAPTCQLTSTGSPYCQYVGKVKSIYINKNNLILIYFDTNLNIENAESIGYSPTSATAAAFPLDEKPEFAKLFYSTALAAQASGRNITIQMRGTYGAYLKFDRIWLAE